MSSNVAFKIASSDKLSASPKKTSIKKVLPNKMITNTKTLSTRREINNLPWIEKHRPGKINNVKIDSQIKKQIKKMIENKDCPNMILEGPPGVGKTSTIRCIAREMYGKYYKDMVLEMNASDERGIKIQESIENFRRAFVNVQEDDNVPTFRMVILDEADNMTDKAKHIISVHQSLMNMCKKLCRHPKGTRTCVLFEWQSSVVHRP